MENGVEALKIASGMLIFVLALTITISAFTSASQAITRILTAKESEEYVKDADGNYINYVNYEGETREVGVETIIPTIYRAYKENFAIYFYNSDGTSFKLYEKDGQIVNYVDLEKEVHTSPESAIQNINELLENGLYETLANNTFTERLGEYYMDDVTGETDTAEVNKVKKRVIAYKQM